MVNGIKYVRKTKTYQYHNFALVNDTHDISVNLEQCCFCVVFLLGNRLLSRIDFMFRCIVYNVKSHTYVCKIGNIPNIDTPLQRTNYMSVQTEDTTCQSKRNILLDNLKDTKIV